jgi:hypothetical protein
MLIANKDLISESNSKLSAFIQANMNFDKFISDHYRLYEKYFLKI